MRQVRQGVWIATGRRYYPHELLCLLRIHGDFKIHKTATAPVNPHEPLLMLLVHGDYETRMAATRHCEVMDHIDLSG